MYPKLKKKLKNGFLEPFDDIFWRNIKKIRSFIVIYIEGVKSRSGRNDYTKKHRSSKQRDPVFLRIVQEGLLSHSVTCSNFLLSTGIGSCVSKTQLLKNVKPMLVF